MLPPRLLFLSCHLQTQALIETQNRSKAQAQGQGQERTSAGRCGGTQVQAVAAAASLSNALLALCPCRLDGSTRQQQEALRALVESTTRELAHGVRKFVVNPERSTFTRKTGGKDARGRRRIVSL